MGLVPFPALVTLTAGFLGGLLFSLLGLPLPWILGAIFGVIAASRFATNMARPSARWMNVARVILGLAIGSQFSSAILDQIGQYVLSLLFLFPFVAMTGVAGWAYFKHIAGLDNRTAFLCAMPGGLSEMLTVGEDLRADIRKIALVQGTRVLVLVYTLPFIAGYLSEAEVGGNPKVMPTLWESDFVAILILIIIGLGGWGLFKRLGVSGAQMVGPMVIAAGLSMFGWLPQGPPDELFKAGQWMLGCSVGGIFIGYSLRKMGEVIWLSAGFLVLLAILTPITAGIIFMLTDFSFVSALLAFAPGGQAESSLIAMILGENTGYVAIHHLIRLIIMVSLVPILARFLFKSVEPNA